MLQIVVSLTDDTRSINYDRNTFIIQATVTVRFICRRFVTKKSKCLTITDEEKSFFTLIDICMKICCFVWPLNNFRSSLMFESKARSLSQSNTVKNTLAYFVLTSVVKLTFGLLWGNIPSHLNMVMFMGLKYKAFTIVIYT